MARPAISVVWELLTIFERGDPVMDPVKLAHLRYVSVNNAGDVGEGPRGVEEPHDGLVALDDQLGECEQREL